MEAAAFAVLAALGAAAIRLVHRQRIAAEVAREGDFDRLAAQSPVVVPVLGRPTKEAELFPVMDLVNFVGGAQQPKLQSPISLRKWPLNTNFVTEGEMTLTTQPFRASGADSAPCPRAFLTAGPFAEIAWDPSTVRVAIVTSGNVCPGVNVVVREIVNSLSYVYGVPAGSIFGIENGFRGFGLPLRPLTPEVVSKVHHSGGAFLGMTRGGFDLEEAFGSLVEHRIGMLFVVGGIDAHKAAVQLQRRAAAVRHRLCVACVPKSIANEIGIIDRSFGFESAVEAAVRPLSCAHTEALAVRSGVGLVKLPGRTTGWLAIGASMASLEANVTLIPEAPWRLSRLIDYLVTRLDARGHCLIAIAEGAEAVEQRECREAAAREAGAAGKQAPAPRVDGAGEEAMEDVGVWLKDRISAAFKKAGRVVNVKYIDPSYTIRSAPANAADSALCTQLAFNAVHAAMAGKTGFSIGVVDGCQVILPASTIATMPPRRVDPNSRAYARMVVETGHPDLS